MRSAGSIWTWVSVVLVFIIAWRAFMWYPQLPDRFPIHFDATGSPDRWVAKQPIMWALIPLFATALALLFHAIAAKLPHLALKHPGLVNTGDGQAFQRLSPEGRWRVLRPTCAFLRWTAAMILGLFLYITEGIASTAVHSDTRHSAWPVMVFVGALLLGVLLLLHRTRQAERRALLDEGLPAHLR